MSILLETGILDFIHNRAAIAGNNVQRHRSQKGIRIYKKQNNVVGNGESTAGQQ